MQEQNVEAKNGATEDNKENDTDKTESELVLNKKSEVLAMALGVEIKRGIKYLFVINVL